jgi:WD40 repeat protein
MNSLERQPYKFLQCVLGQLKVWCVATGELLGVVRAHNKPIRSLCTTKDGLYIATGSHDNTIKLWRADTLVYETTLVGHTSQVTCVVATSMYVLYSYLGNFT